MAHDFNNQLTVIQGYTDMLMGNFAPAYDVRRLAEIPPGRPAMHCTTSHLLSLSRKQILHPEPCNVGELLQAMCGPVALMIGEDIRLNVFAVPGLPEVLIDRSGLQQAVMNLIVNSRDAMPDGGELVVQTGNCDIGPGVAAEFRDAPAGRYVLLEITDTGQGMDRKTLDRVFDPFFTTKEVGKGTGLGLPMVLGFVQQSHGSVFIDIYSQPGKGTAVRILLPAVLAENPHDPQGQHRQMSSIRTQDKATVVVEDEQAVGGLIAGCLREQGYELLEASTPSQALAMIAEHQGPLDLLITDMVMPEMNGADLAKRIKADRKSVRTLFVTGYLNEGLERRFPMCSSSHSGRTSSSCASVPR